MKDKVQCISSIKCWKHINIRNNVATRLLLLIQAYKSYVKSEISTSENLYFSYMVHEGLETYLHKLESSNIQLVYSAKAFNFKS